jgi:methionyl-tRNA synthetase
LAGPYVAADIAVRAARRGGRRVLAVCGLDDNQNYVLARARKEDRDVIELRAHYAGLIRGVFDRIGIRYDEFAEPAVNGTYRDAVLRFLDELVAAGKFPITEWQTPACPNCPGTLHHAYVAGACPGCSTRSGGGTCEGCGGYTPATALVDPQCTRCGSAATAVATVRGPVVRLEDHRGVIEHAWFKGTLPPRARRLVWDILDNCPLPDVPICYPTDWGIRVPSLPEHRLDVWVEMGLGYLHTIGQLLDPDAHSLAEHVAAWHRRLDALWVFLGLDNAFYYLALFPAIFAAAGTPWEVINGLVVNEFYRLDGLKFSTSRNHAVWAHELLEDEDPAAVRAFLSWDRPSPHPTNFTMPRYRQAIESWSRPLRSAGLNPADLARAERALALEHFDGALAARCLLTHGFAGESDGLLEVITGTSRRPSVVPIDQARAS